MAVVLAFLASALSLAAVLLAWNRRGEVPVVPLAGGLLMLVLAVTGLGRIRGGRDPDDSEGRQR
ncbi:MAG TPA: hypothetical protein VD833_08260 [Vicinamibacterales bacterium]|nr:hypothetical protein [Vicinamibacterales bacterium]